MKNWITTLFKALWLSFGVFIVSSIIMFVISLFGDISQWMKNLWFYGNILYFLFMVFVVSVSGKTYVGTKNIVNNTVSTTNPVRGDVFLTTIDYQDVEEYLHKEPAYPKQLIEAEAEELKQSFIAKYNEMKFNPAIINTNNPKEVYLTNEEAVQFLEKEFESLQKLASTDLQDKVLKLYQYYCFKMNNPMPIEPIKQFIQTLNVDNRSLIMFRDNLLQLESIHKQAMRETEKNLKIIASGVIGEENVGKELSMYDYLWKRFTGLRMEIDGMSVETDSLIITTRGIFSLEIKNYAKNGTYSLHITKDGQWGKVYENGKKEVITDSVTSQMNRHIALKQKLVNQELQVLKGTTTPFISFQPIFVIANEKVHIQNDSDLPIMRASQVYHHIMKYPEILTPQQIVEIVTIIEKHRLPLKKYGFKQYTNLFQTIANTANDNYNFASDAVNLIPEFESNVNKKVNHLN